MTMPQIGRPAFNSQFHYRLVLSSDNIDLKHCGNCAHLNGIVGDLRNYGCSLMKQCGIPPEGIRVNVRRGLCDFHQRKNP